MLGTVLCPERSTLSNLICTYGGQHGDWSADYRLYFKDRVEESVLFGKVRGEVMILAEPRGEVTRPMVADEPVVVVKHPADDPRGDTWRGSR